jgi:DNA-binding transcriptional ArsR family regulator
MSEFDPSPSSDTLEREREVRRETRDARQRVREVLLSSRGPTGVGTIAERADCSPNTARKHLRDLADLGIARAVTDGEMTRYRRNDEFVRWRRANRLVERFDAPALLDRVGELEDRDEAFAAEFGVTSPGAVPIPEDADHATVEEHWERAREWAAVRDDLAVARDALRMARRDLSAADA